MSYTVTQVVNATQLTPTSASVTAAAYPGGYMDEKMQQLIIPFSQQSTTMAYWVHIDIPQNQNYDLNYGIRLLNSNAAQSSNIPYKDRTDYQFVKYISVPKINRTNIETSNIWLYRTIGSNIVNAAVAKPLPADSNPAQRANKIYYNLNTATPANSIIYRYDNTGSQILDNDNANWFNKIEYCSTIMPHSFNITSNTSWPNEFLILPSDLAYDTIYLYLKPIGDDRNIIHDGDMIGRYIEDLTQIQVTYAPINNNIINSNFGQVKNIGVWGRSGQLMMINGQEIKIGPSGYFELKDFDIKTLYIANVQEFDKYTVDIQYEN